jgi:peptidoglycan hydrolase-like protein with peptidoglycan-binding domain
MRTAAALVAALLCIVLTVTTAAADRRVAFVAGNAAQDAIAALPNPTIDARTTAVALRNVGFEVVEGANLTRGTMLAALSAPVDPAIHTEVGSQLTEDQIGLERNQRRDLQRRLTRLGFDTKATGKFDGKTRNVIKRWQAARGYPDSGFLTKLQHDALLSEIIPENTAAIGERPRKRAPARPSGGGARGGPPNPFQVLQPVGRAIFGR